MITLALVLMLLADPPASTSDLPAEARLHNDRGVALFYAGQYEEGIAELERAYAVMSDPLRYRAGRGKVVGSLRSALQQRYSATGATVHLCRQRELLRLHRDALLAALGPAGRPGDVSGTDEAIRELDVTLRDRPCGESKSKPTPAVPSPVVAPKQPAGRRQGLRIAGGVLMGAGFASIGVMTFGVVAMADNRDKLRSMTAAVAASGEPPDSGENFAAGERYARAYNRRTLAVVTGVLGGAAVLSGIVLRVAGRRRAEMLARVPVSPAVGPGFAGLAGRIVF
jgi:hypothetical protein